MEKIDLPYLEDEPEFTNKFFFPEEYNYTENEIAMLLRERCKNQKEINRTEEELYIFNEIGKLDLIRYFLYLVDYMNNNHIVWGVGRGSSVSVFIFYLIGIHKVNSVTYDLDYTDFFKIKE